MDGIEVLATVKAAACIAAAIAISVGCVGAALGQGMIGKQACDSIGKYPDSSGKIQTAMMMSLAAVESCAVYCLLIALIVLFKVL